MIKKIGLKNFRVFKDYTEFELKPITLLTGPNNSGKSSFTKLLLLLKNGIEELDFFEGQHNLISYCDNLSWDARESEFLEFLTIKLFGMLHGCSNDIVSEFNFVDSHVLEDGGALKEFYVNIGKEKFIFITAEEGYHEGEPDDSVNFTYSCDFNPLIKLIISKEIFIDSIPLSELSTNYLNVPGLSSLNIENLSRYKSMILKEITEKRVYDDEFFLNMEDTSENVVSKKEYECLKAFYIKNEEFNSFHALSRFTTKDKGIIINNLIDKIKEDNKVMFQLFINGQNLTKKYEHLLTLFNGIYSETGYTIGGDDYYVKNIYEELKSFSDSLIKENCSSDFDIIKQKLREDFDEKELNTIEFKPTTLYKFLFLKTDLFGNKSFWEWITQDFSNINNTFKDLKFIKANRGNQNRVLLFNSRKDIYDQFLLANSKKYLKQIETLFELPGEIIIESVESTAVIISIKTADQKINLADLGFGFSQLVPVILKILDSSGNTTLIVEEPEANLHPKLQSKLADFFVISQKYFPSIRFIIETHSEYLIRKLQYLTAKKEIKIEDSIIYYFNDDRYVTKEEPKVKSIEINENGTLTDSFGPGFYDEATRLQFDLLKLNKPQNN